MKGTLNEVVSDLKQLAISESQLTVNYNHLVELSHVLQKCDDIFSSARLSQSEVVPRSLSAADLTSMPSGDTEGAGGGLAR